MAKFKLPVTWEVCGVVEVEAESLEAAVDYFNENSDYIKLPTGEDVVYVDGSFNLSCNEISYLELFQDYKLP